MKRSIGVIILQVAVSLFLLVSGIYGIIGSTAGELAPVVAFVNQLFNSQSAATIMIVVLSVCELVAGLFLFMELFTTDLRITDMILAIFIVLWIVNIVLVHFITRFGGGTAFHDVGDFLAYLRALSRDLMVLGALVMVARKFN